MKNKRRQMAYEGDSGYPSFSVHRATRRQFLVGAASALGLGALAAACEVSGIPGGNNNPDTGNINGNMPYPNYYQSVQLPLSGYREITLTNGTVTQFWVLAWTEQQDCVYWAQANEAALTDELADELATWTDADLATSTGFLAAEQSLVELLNTAYSDDIGSVSTSWFYNLELSLVPLSG